MFVKANLKEFLKMTEADKAVLEPRLTPLKQRLLVSHYLRDHPIKAAPRQVLSPVCCRVVQPRSCARVWLPSGGLPLIL